METIITKVSIGGGLMEFGIEYLDELEVSNIKHFEIFRVMALGCIFLSINYFYHTFFFIQYP